MSDDEQNERSLPNRSHFGRGTLDQIRRLAEKRPYAREGLELAHKRGVLVFAMWHAQEVYGVTDRSGRVLEIRRVDGIPFSAVPACDIEERKSHAVKGSQKSWPVGILGAQEFDCIALVEGMPDFLEAHYLTLWEGAASRVAPVAMLSSAPKISPDALKFFSGKRVRIFPHVDEAGLRGGERWQQQLIQVSARVDIFDFPNLSRIDGKAVNDLCDFRDLHPDEYRKDSSLWTILP
jgi:hypothetical protein